MADIGSDLRQARLGRKQSIEDISRATKINVSMLQAIENDAFSRLPSGLFTRGFLRAYAREVGLDPEVIVSRYRSEYESAPSGPTERTAGSPEPPLGRVRMASDDVDAETASARRTQLLQLSIVLLIVILYFATWRQPRTQAGGDAKQSAPAAAPSDRETAVATSGRETPPAASAPQPAPAPTPTPTTMEIKAQGPCWIEATAGGRRLVSRLMDADNTETLPLTEELTLRVGDPSTFTFTIDGVKGQPVGQPGKPVTIRINRDNYKSFLEPR